jgi:hypothetical protein
MNKFKVGDKVVTNRDIETIHKTIEKGCDGTITEVSEYVTRAFVSFKELNILLCCSDLDLKQESDENMEYNWHEAIEMVLNDESLEMQSESYSAKMSNENGSVIWLCDNGIKFNIVVTKEFINSKWTIVKPQTDWTKVAVDTKVVVWCNGSNKLNRHFAKFENGKVCTFADGTSSYTNECDNITHWKNAELFEEQE